MNWSSVGALADILAAFAAVTAIAWGVLEFRRRNLAELDARVAELLGVSLTYELRKPRPTEAVDGWGRFSYDFTLHNPGRLPINRATVEITYPVAVRRVHSDAARTTDAPRATYKMHVASIAARGDYTWRRNIQVPIEVWPQMSETTAKITFRSPDVGERSTTWPDAAEFPSRSLRARLRAAAG